MTDTKPSTTKPIPITVRAKRYYYHCQCGLSRSLPFCDGSHQGSGVQPRVWQAPVDGEVLFCVCRRSRDSGVVVCDGEGCCFDD